MFTVHPDGKITCDTLEEALRLQRQIVARQQMQTRAVTQVNGETPTQAFLSKLKGYENRGINSEQLRKLTDTGSMAGLGPKLRHLRNALGSEGIDLGAILIPNKGRNDQGMKTWEVRFHSKETKD